MATLMPITVEKIETDSGCAQRPRNRTCAFLDQSARESTN
jgi:hypothetical protein